MGFGIKDETSNTQIFFVTTGYLVRKLAHHPSFFLSHTHLIIDEVHERSVDGDILCLFARKLLQSHPTIRLILMSATIHVELYRNYFKQTDEHDYYGDLECLSVGVRRFPIEIHYIDDLARQKPEYHMMCKKLAGNRDGKNVVPKEFSKDQYNLVVSIIRNHAVLGTGVLVFVSGTLWCVSV
jgi:HrpA-like RNA helicase